MEDPTNDEQRKRDMNLIVSAVVGASEDGNLERVRLLGELLAAVAADSTNDSQREMLRSLRRLAPVELRATKLARVRLAARTGGCPLPRLTGKKYEPEAERAYAMHDDGLFLLRAGDRLTAEDEQALQYLLLQESLKGIEKKLAVRDADLRRYIETGRSELFPDLNEER